MMLTIARFDLRARGGIAGRRRCPICCLLLAVAFLGVSRNGTAQDSVAVDSEAELAVSAIQRSLGDAQSQLAQLRDRVPPMMEEVEDLIQRLSALERPPEKPEPKPKETGAKTVPFRPPRIHETDKKPRYLIVCEENRIAVLDLENRGNSPYLKIEPTGRGGAKLSRKGSSMGEPVTALNDPNSMIGRVLGQGDSNQYYLQFSVYPDSFDLFRDARSAAWKSRFETHWIAYASSEVIYLGGGTAHVD
jgi:hypothetical protein